jgi:hypothetical protein
MLFPMLTAEKLHLVLYLSTEYYNSKLNMIIGDNGERGLVAKSILVIHKSKNCLQGRET